MAGDDSIGGMPVTGVGSFVRPPDPVNHPPHYGGDTPYEAIKVIEAWELGFSLGNCVKYIARAGIKDPAREIEDLEKAAWYLAHHIRNRKAALERDS